MAVAQYVMGYHPVFDSILGELWIVEEGREPIETPSFSASAEAVQAVLEQIRTRQLEAIFLKNLEGIQGVSNDTGQIDDYISQYQPTPEQICRAALLSVRQSS